MRPLSPSGCGGVGRVPGSGCRGQTERALSAIRLSCAATGRWRPRARPRPTPGRRRRRRAGRRAWPACRAGSARRRSPALARADALDLHGRLGDLAGQVPDVVAATRPRSSQRAPGWRPTPPALVGEGVDATPVDLLARDEALVGELLERGVDGARARPPAAAALRLELLDDLVAVHRPGRQDREDQRPDLAAADHGAAAATASAAGSTAVAASRTACRRDRRGDRGDGGAGRVVKVW